MLFPNKKSFLSVSICFVLSLYLVLFSQYRTMNNSNTIRIEAEDYQDYYDLTSGNKGKAYRNDDVDIWKMKRGGFRVAAIQPDEWLDYSLDVPEDGKYKIVSRVGSKNKRDRKFSVSLDGQSTTLSFNSLDNKYWQDITSQEIELTKGNHQLRLNALTKGFSIDYLELIPVSNKQKAAIKSESIDNKNSDSTIVDLDNNTNSNNMSEKNNSVTSGTGNGLKGEYYDSKSFSNLKLTRTDSNVDFEWNNNSPDSSIGSDTFSARWTGQIEPLFSETYNFHTTSDDGVRLWVDGQLIVDKFVDRRSTQDTATIDLVAGKKYDIRMEYYENSGKANANLAWSSNSQSFEIVPSSQLYSESIDNTNNNSKIVILDNNTNSNNMSEKKTSTANIVSSESFDDNNLEDFSYQRPRGDSIESSSLYDRDGSGQSIQFNLLPNDKDVEGSRRTELRLNSDIGEFKIGDETWIGFSVLAPPTYQYDDSFEIIFQMHSYPDLDLGEEWRSPPLNLRIEGGDFLLSHSYDTKPVTINNTPEDGYEYNLGALEPGVWTDFALHIDYQLNDNGAIELYQNGELAYSYQGKVGFNDAGGMFTKFGIYKPDWKYNPQESSTTERTLYFDAFKKARGEADLIDVDPATIYSDRVTGVESKSSSITMGSDYSLNETLSFNLDSVPEGKGSLNLQAYDLDKSNELSIYLNDELMPLNETFKEEQSFQTSITFDSSVLNTGENTIKLMANPDDSYFIIEQIDITGFN